MERKNKGRKLLSKVYRPTKRIIGTKEGRKVVIERRREREVKMEKRRNGGEERETEEWRNGGEKIKEERKEGKGRKKMLTTPSCTGSIRYTV